MNRMGRESLKKRAVSLLDFEKDGGVFWIKIVEGKGPGRNHT